MQSSVDYELAEDKDGKFPWKPSGRKQMDSRLGQEKTVWGIEKSYHYVYT